MKKIIGVIAPALELKMGVTGREKEVAETKAAEPLLAALGTAIGEMPGGVLALSGQMGLQEVCRQAFLRSSKEHTLEYSFFSSRSALEKHGVKLSNRSEPLFIGGGKDSLAYYEAMIKASDAVIFAGGFYRAAAAGLVAFHAKGKKFGILEGAGNTPKALMEFLKAIGMPESGRERLFYEKDPKTLLERIFS